LPGWTTPLVCAPSFLSLGWTIGLLISDTQFDPCDSNSFVLNTEDTTPPCHVFEDPISLGFPNGPCVLVAFPLEPTLVMPDLLERADSGSK